MIVRIVKYLIFLSVYNFASTLHQSTWVDGQRLSDYTKQNSINISLSKISQDELYLIEQARGSGQSIYELREDSQKLQKILMPLGDDMQISLERSGDEFNFALVPIDTYENIYFSNRDIKKDLKTSIKSIELLAAVQDAVKKYKINIKPNDSLSMIYMQKSIDNHKYGQVELRLIRVQSANKERTLALGSSETSVINLRKEIINKPHNMRFDTLGGDMIGTIDTKFDKPLRDMLITSSFSYGRFHPVLGVYRPHFGTDFRAAINTPIMSILDGVVIFSGHMGGYGKVVKIKHSNGYISLYGHLNSINVYDGQAIKRGGLIAYSGNSGVSSGPHLHLGLYHNGTPVNPMRYIR